MSRSPGDRPASEILPDDSDPVLVDLLRDEIERNGPIPFERFMEVALYDPARGYYATAATRGSRSGDFLSAPELHPVFGRLVGRQLADCWDRLGRPATLVVREHGAGSGALAEGIVAGLGADGSPLLDALVYEPVEIEPSRSASIAARLARLGAGDRIRPPTPGPATGVVLANELLDALPVHRVVMSGGRLRELLVDHPGDRFVEVVGPEARPAITERLAAEGVLLGEGAIGEVCLALDAWVDSAARGLQRGYLLVIDYGHPAETLYSPRRARGTLLAYRGHRVVDDPLRDVGRQDLTTHVDLTALERAAARNGLVATGRTTQAAFVAALGLGDLLADSARSTIDQLQAHLELRAAAIRLLDPRALGAFRVLAFGRGVPMSRPLRGFRAEDAGAPWHRDLGTEGAGPDDTPHE